MTNPQTSTVEIEASLSHYGEHYYLDTHLELSGRGIRYYGQNGRGMNQYKVTIKAYDKLKAQYQVSKESTLD
jgi:hypothetical protein